MTTPTAQPPEHFWMAGYECADQLNKFGNRVNLLQDTGHLERLCDDYEDILSLGITAVREGICWSVVETGPYQYDWTAVTQRILAAQQLNIRQLWDICHFGFPDDLSPLHPHFAPRFAALCTAFVRHCRSLCPSGTLYITPINEISFLSWLGGDACGTAPFCVKLGWEVKYHLCKAFIAGVAAMRAIHDDICILSTEPLINVVATEANTLQEWADASRLTEDQYQAVDIITGRMCPELGGQESYIDIVGVNFYFHNQWNVAPHSPLAWAQHDRHPQWTNLHLLLKQVADRYGKPIVLSETSHAGEDRGLWMQHIAEECLWALQLGVPLQGICLYPIIDRPDWDFPDIWHRSGLWDEAPLPEPGQPRRLINVPYLQALQQAQASITSFFKTATKNDFPIPISLPMYKTTQTTGQLSSPDVILCFSHLRWDFVYQRPQHILSRLSAESMIYYIEEPVFADGNIRYERQEKGHNLTVLVPHLPHHTSPEGVIALLKTLVDELMHGLRDLTTALWYYTPMALPYTRHLHPAVTIFDCMDELSAFRFAPQELLALEQELLNKADVVFTGGASLYEAKKNRHENVHFFASSIDKEHFGKARALAAVAPANVEPAAPILGFFGVIDERFDIPLLAEMASARPDWQFIITGPVVKIDAATLPQNANILYTGGRKYEELPALLANWDIAMIPFALNESTRFISPTKTPEYLAAGKPVISSPIRDVVHPYGDQGLVHIAATATEWIAAAEQILASQSGYQTWLAAVDSFLAGNSWDATVAAMADEISAAIDPATSNTVQQKTTATVTTPALVQGW